MAFPSLRGGASGHTSIAQLGRWLSAWFLGAQAPTTPKPGLTTNGDQGPKPMAMVAVVAPVEPVAPVAEAPDAPAAESAVVPALPKTRSRTAGTKARAIARKRPARVPIALRSKSQKAGSKAKAGKTRATVAKKTSPKVRTTRRSTKGSARTAKSRRTR